MSRLVWTAITAAAVIPIGIAATSPFLAFRNPAYIIAGFAGIACLSLLLIQPLLAVSYPAGLTVSKRRKLHRWIGAGLVVGVLLHVGGLYLTSPPDTLDALLLVSPTPFSVYGVIAFWGLLCTAVLALLRRRLQWRIGVWNVVHNALALVVVVSTVVHALQIEGTMGTVSKVALCALVLIVTAVVLIDKRIIKSIRSR